MLFTWVPIKCSLPCESLSPADASNMSRVFHHHDHTNPTKPPCSLESCKTPEALAKRNKAILVGRMCKSILASFLQGKKDGYKYGMTIGSLGKTTTYMQGEMFESVLRRTAVDYCVYEKPYRKSTDFWTSYNWTPKGPTGNGRRNNGMCKMGKTICKGTFKHRCAIAGCNERRVTGVNVKKTLWSIPHDFIDEMLAKATDQAIKHNNKMNHTDCTDRLTDTQTDTTNKPEAMYVIDKFSGGQSWRPSVEKIGMIYIQKIKWWSASVCSGHSARTGPVFDFITDVCRSRHLKMTYLFQDQKAVNSGRDQSLTCLHKTHSQWRLSYLDI